MLHYIVGEKQYVSQAVSKFIWCLGNSRWKVPGYYLQ